MGSNIIPGLLPQQVNYEAYYEHVPEKLEVLDGVLCGDEEEAGRLLLLLLYNLGIKKTIQLAPKEIWKEALGSTMNTGFNQGSAYIPAQCGEAVLPYKVGTKATYTYEDYAKLPEGAPYQLIGGKLVMTPAPGKKHQNILIELAFMFKEFIKINNIGELAVAPRDVFLAPGETYQPDILFITNERLEISAEDKVNGAPDLVVEILSPSTAYYDLRKKYKAYEKYGVREYWIVDPEEKSIEVYGASDGKFVLAMRAEESGTVSSAVMQGFSVKTEEVFRS